MTQVKENEGLRFLTSKAAVIDELEFTMPRWIKNRNPDWYPAYIHILRVSMQRANYETIVQLASNACMCTSCQARTHACNGLE